jgi:Zn-dependent M28 family amino/carboxypeptidase
MKKITLVFCTLALSIAHLGFSTISSAQSTPEQHPALRDLQILSSEKMQGRAPGTEGHKLAQTYLIQRLQEIGLRPCGENFIQEQSLTNPRGQTKTMQNILACKAGSETNLAGKNVIVLSAHYDHLGVKNGKIYHGADDNASGVAALLEIATQMQQQPLKHDVVLAFFDAEEQGKLGAFAYTKHTTIPLENIGLNINLDMVARGDKGELYASGSHATPALKPILDSLPSTPEVKLMFGHDRPEQGQDDWTTQSDHHAFFKAGIPHLYFGVEDHADYHQPSDQFEKVKPSFYLAAIDLIKQATYAMDTAMLSVDLRQSRNKK